MYTKKILTTVLLFSLAACNAKPTTDVNDDIVGSSVNSNTSSNASSNVSSGDTSITYNKVEDYVPRKREQIVSPITEERVVKLETASPLAGIINFSFDSDILDETSLKHLDAIAELLDKEKKVSVIIEGHCDERGTKAYNLALGARRAQAVKDYLVNKKDINQKRLTTVSYGEEKPVVVGTDRESYAKNRRVEFKVK